MTADMEAINRAGRELERLLGHGDFTVAVEDIDNVSEVAIYDADNPDANPVVIIRVYGPNPTDDAGDEQPEDADEDADADADA